MPKAMPTILRLKSICQTHKRKDMINIKELSVGNWVYNKHHGKAIQITPFDFFTHTHNKEGKQCLVGNPNLVSGKDFEPIPISPEILKKNGWQLSEYSSATLVFENKIVVVEFYESGTQLRIFKRAEDEDLQILDISVSGVHQLQNALILCKINKEIEL